MNVIAINGSPRANMGTTAKLLNSFIKGMETAGAEVELINAKKFNINCCTGCCKCSVLTPGKCQFEDEMSSILSKLKKANLWVLAAPLYFDGFPSQIKNIIDRTFPLADPHFEIRDNHTRKPIPEDAVVGKVALVSTCGNYEIDNFDPIVAQVKAICRNMSKTYSGALLRPHSMCLKDIKIDNDSLDEIYEASERAGYNLISNGVIEDELLNVVSKDLIGRDDYVLNYNSWIDSGLKMSKKIAVANWEDSLF